MDIKTAVDRLSAQLPLKVRQDRLSPALKTLHKYVLYSLVQQGRPPSPEELAQQLGKENIKDGLQQLASDDLIVLDAAGKNPLGAYPVTMEQTPHKISVNGHAIHAMCALDAVSVAPLFDAAVLIESACHVSQTPISINIQGSEILQVSPSAEVIVGIRWQQPTTVAAHSMCTEMVFLKDRRTAQEWQDDDSENISLFTLPEAVEFGKGFFLPLLD